MSEPHKCACPAPGWCELFGRYQGTRAHEVCKNDCPPERPCPGPVQRELLIQRWYEEAGRTPPDSPVKRIGPPHKPAKKLYGPGTELKNLVKELGFDIKLCLSCAGMLKRMNEWGPDGCRTNRDEIIAHLKAAKDETSWSEYLKAATLAITSVKILTIGGLVDEAIRRAEVRLCSSK